MILIIDSISPKITMTEYKIPLYNKKKEIADYALVSQEDYENVSKYNWSLLYQKIESTGSERKYAHGHVDGQRMRMHHYILGKPENRKMVVDHKNSNGLDNRRENIHYVTSEANGQNKQVDKTDKTSKYTGVSKIKDKWTAKYGGLHLGNYETEEDAAKVYDKFVLVKLGPTAKTNGLVPYDDVKDKKLDDVMPNKDRMYDLPKNMTYHKKRDEYMIKLIYKGSAFRAKNKSLEGAKKDLEEIMKKVNKLKLDDEEAHNNTQIERNSDNIAVITCRNKKKEVAGYVLVDDDKWHELKKSSWYIDDGGYAAARINKKLYRMHEYLMPNEDEKKFIDHINGVRVDNRISNLRIVCISSNNQNRKKSDKATSTYNGVSLVHGRWEAGCRKNDIRYRMTFETEIEAAICYNIFAKALYGSFAKLNNIDNIDKYEDGVLEVVKQKYQDITSSAENNNNSENDPDINNVSETETDINNITSKYTGVSLVDGRWEVVCRKNDICYVMAFDTETEAAISHNIFAKSLYGSSAKLNDIDSTTYFFSVMRMVLSKYPDLKI